MKNHKKTIIIVLITIMFIPGMMVSGQQGPEVEENEAPFVRQLAEQLRERNWGEDAIRQLTAQAQALNWNGTENADPDLIAYALSYEKPETGWDEEDGLERAQMALELAVTSLEMEAVGFNQQTVAKAAVNGVIDTLNQIQEWKAGNRETNLGEIIRQTVRNNILQEAAARGNTEKRQAIEQLKTERIKKGGVIPTEISDRTPSNTPRN